MGNYAIKVLRRIADIILELCSDDKAKILIDTIRRNRYIVQELIKAQNMMIISSVMRRHDGKCLFSTSEQHEINRLLSSLRARGRKMK